MVSNLTAWHVSPKTSESQIPKWIKWVLTVDCLLKMSPYTQMQLFSSNDLSQQKGTDVNKLMHEKWNKRHKYWFQILYFSLFGKMFLVFFFFFLKIGNAFQYACWLSNMLVTLMQSPSKTSQNYFHFHRCCWSEGYRIIPFKSTTLPNPKLSLNWKQHAHLLTSFWTLGEGIQA